MTYSSIDIYVPIMQRSKCGMILPIIVERVRDIGYEIRSPKHSIILLHKLFFSIRMDLDICYKKSQTYIKFVM